MKRFYCKICKKIKHVRVIPHNVASPRAPKPTDRIGECNRHTAIKSNTVYSNRVAVLDPPIETTVRQINRRRK